jgi:hypothetical protein
VTTSEGVLAAATLARSVDILRRAPEPGQAQKAALRALVAYAADHSFTFRHYNDVLTVDGDPIPLDDPRLAAFAQRLIAQHVAEIAIAKGAGPDELLALSLGLASEPGQGRVKERLRDANSTRVMVVLHQFSSPSGSVSAAFEKVKFDQSVLDEWNRFLQDAARPDLAPIIPAPESDSLELMEPGDLEPRSGPAAAAPQPPAARPAPPPSAPRSPARTGFPPSGGARDVPSPPPPRPSQMIQQPPALQGSPSLNTWFAAFERSVQNKFADHFGDVDWGFVVDRDTAVVRAGDPGGRASVEIQLPDGFLEESAWMLAGRVLTELRAKAEKEAGIRRRR